MLLRGANAMGYTNYPGNVVHNFCKQNSKSGVNIFRIFNYINYINNLKLGADAASSAGGFVRVPPFTRVIYHNPTRASMILSIT